MCGSQTIRTAAGVLLIAAAFWNAGCASPAEKDEAALKNDRQAQETLRQLNAETAAQRNVSNAGFEELKKLREKYPNSPTVLNYYKSALIYRNDLQALEKFLLRDGKIPASPEDRKTLATLYVESGQFAKAAELLDPLVNADPKNLELRGLAGLSYLRLGELDRSAENFDAVWDQILEKKLAPEISLRGIVYYRQNKLEKALETLKIAEGIDPNHITTNNTLSQVYREMGNAQKAEEFAKKAYTEQEESAERDRAESKIVEKKILLEQAWKANDFRKVIDLTNELLPDAKSLAEKQVMYQYLYNSYKKLGMEKEAARILERARAENK